MKQLSVLLVSALALIPMTSECTYGNKKLNNNTHYSLTIKWLKKKKISKTEVLKPQASISFETEEFSAEMDPSQAPAEFKNKAFMFKPELNDLASMTLEENGCPEIGQKKISSLYGCVSALPGADDWEVNPKIINSSELPK